MNAAALTLASALASAGPIAAAPDEPLSRSGRPPSVILVMADQWRQEAFGFAGNKDVRTPNLDRFARESVQMANAVSTVPVCCPARASLLTGRRALSHGVFMNDVPLNPAEESMAKIFARAGYYTAYIGKWHVDGHGRSAFIPAERRQGFRYWKALECTHDYNHSAYYADEPVKRWWPGYDAEAQTDDAVRLIQSRARGRAPFLLVLSWGPPHEPYGTAPPRFRALYDPKRLHLRPNVPAQDEEAARRDLAGYYAHCTALDECFGRLWDACKEAGIEEDVLLIFTSDHGDMLYSHGSQKKQQPWEESARVPLLVHWPVRLGRKALCLSAPMQTEDILPTLLGLCHIPVPPSVEGTDYSRYLTGGPDPSDGAALISCPAPFGQWDRAHGGREYRAIRTRRYTYARDLNGPWLLFDNVKDPYQMHNLVNTPEAARIQARLEQVLRKKLRQTGDMFLPAGEYIRKWGYRVDATGTVPYTD
ncbi:MAG: sulfatase family protein [Chthonomonadales bacterium]